MLLSKIKNRFAAVSDSLKASIGSSGETKPHCWKSTTWERHLACRRSSSPSYASASRWRLLYRLSPQSWRISTMSRASSLSRNGIWSWLRWCLLRWQWLRSSIRADCKLSRYKLLEHRWARMGATPLAICNSLQMTRMIKGVSSSHGDSGNGSSRFIPACSAYRLSSHFLTGWPRLHLLSFYCTSGVKMSLFGTFCQPCRPYSCWSSSRSIWSLSTGPC